MEQMMQEWREERGDKRKNDREERHEHRKKDRKERRKQIDEFKEDVLERLEYKVRTSTEENND